MNIRGMKSGEPHPSSTWRRVWLARLDNDIIVLLTPHYSLFQSLFLCLVDNGDWPW